MKIHKCIGCGYCCRTAQCALSTWNFGIHVVCPVLCWRDNRYWCGMVLTATNADEIKEMLAIGGGCSGTLFNNHRRLLEDGFDGTREEFEELCPISKPYCVRRDKCQ